MTEPPIPAQPHARDDVVLRQLDDEWVIYDPAAERLHVLNLTAALVWIHCTGDRTIDEIATAVGGSFEPTIAGTTITGDVTEAVRRFGAEQLLA